MCARLHKCPLNPSGCVGGIILQTPGCTGIVSCYCFIGKKAPKEHRPLAIRSLTHIVIYNHSIYTNINIQAVVKRLHKLVIVFCGFDQG